MSMVRSTESRFSNPAWAGNSYSFLLRALDILLRCVGCVLILAFVMKALDPLVLEKCRRATWFSFAIALDLIVGIGLVVNPKSRCVTGICAVLLLTYAGFHLAFPGVPCDCFGNFSSKLGPPLIFGFVVVGFLLCLAGVVFFRGKRVNADSVTGTWGKGLGLGIGIVLCLIPYLQFHRSPLIGELTVIKPGPVKGSYLGVMRFKNRTGQELRLLRGHNAICTGVLRLDGDEVVSSFSSVSVECIVSGNQQFGTITGAVQLRVASSQGSQSLSVPWVGVNP